MILDTKARHKSRGTVQGGMATHSDISFLVRIEFESSFMNDSRGSGTRLLIAEFGAEHVLWLVVREEVTLSRDSSSKSRLSIHHSCRTPLQSR